MPRPKKAKIIRKPTGEEVALARVCDALAPAKHEPTTLPEYLAEASEVGLGQLQIGRMGDAADARRTVIDALGEWVERLAEAQAAEMVRKSATVRAAHALEPQPMRPALPAPAETLVLDPDKLPGLELEPFFCSQKVANTFLRLLDAVQRRRWAFYFADFGCLSCGKKDRLHDAAGMCPTCYARTRARINASVERHAGEGREPRRTVPDKPRPALKAKERKP